MFRYNEIDKSAYNSGTKLDQSSGKTDKNPLYAFSLAQLSLGGLNKSKFALVSTRNETVLNKHYQALVNEDLAEYAADLQAQIFGDVCF